MLIINHQQALEVLHENLGYHRLNIYCPYWMVNKTGLTLQYKVSVSCDLHVRLSVCECVCVHFHDFSYYRMLRVAD